MIRSGTLRCAGRLVAWLAAISLIAASGAAADDAEVAWAALAKGGHVAMIRHGNAPFTQGGEPGFKIEDCSTQRNLDDKGRAQARALGDAFRAHGVRVDRVLSSPVCRCMDTASLMAVGSVESTWALVRDRDPRAPVRLTELKALVSGWSGPGTLVLVTHGYTVESLLGFIPGQAETLVLRPAPGSDKGGELVGRIAAP